MIRREHRCGEGFAAQNSSTMVIGVGDHKVATRVTVRWPSGKVQNMENVAVGTLSTVYENAAHSPVGESFVQEPYVKPAASVRFRSGSERLAQRGHTTTKLQLSGESRLSKLRIYTTTATWCTACRKALPQLQLLRESFAPDELALLGVPADTSEGRETLVAYVEKAQPPYELLLHLSTVQIDHIKGIIQKSLHQDALPATIITDSDGIVLKSMWGVPTISDVRRWLNRAPE